MIKQLACIVLLCAVILTARGGPSGGRGRPGGGRGRPGYGYMDQLIAALCANDTVAPQFLPLARQLAADLRANGSYNRFLADQTQTITYIDDPSNTDRLSANCTDFFAGLKNAKIADSTALRSQMQASRSAAKAFAQIFCSLLGTGCGKRSNDNSGSAEDGLF